MIERDLKMHPELEKLEEKVMKKSDMYRGEFLYEMLVHSNRDINRLWEAVVEIQRRIQTKEDVETTRDFNLWFAATGGYPEIDREMIRRAFEAGRKTGGQKA